MTISSRTRPYEVLIRMSEDMKIGCHYIQITEHLDENGVVLAAKTLDPVSLSTKDYPTGDELVGVIGEFATVALSEHSEQTKYVMALESRVKDLELQLSKALAAVPQTVESE